MNILERLISGYPSGDVAPQDFIDHLSIGADGWVGAWIAVCVFRIMVDSERLSSLKKLTLIYSYY